LYTVVRMNQPNSKWIAAIAAVFLIVFATQSAHAELLEKTKKVPQLVITGDNEIKKKKETDDRKTKQDESFFARVRKWFEEVDDHDLK